MALSGRVRNTLKLELRCRNNLSNSPTPADPTALQPPYVSVKAQAVLHELWKRVTQWNEKSWTAWCTGPPKAL
jgi:hypothetical protein